MSPMMKPTIRTACALGLIFAPLWGCTGSDEPRDLPEQAQSPAPVEEAQPVPPAPPVLETFDAAPQLSLFARLGDYRPEEGDEIALPFWRTYQEHLVKTSGVVRRQETGDRAYSFRSIRGIDSVGFFSPLAVEPATSYRVSFRIRTDLPEGGRAGVGVVEYDQFLWVGEQYTRTLDKRHRTGLHQGVTLTGKSDWEHQSFVFTTSPRTRMIHLTLFREGTPDRQPVLVDDIRIERESAELQSQSKAMERRKPGAQQNPPRHREQPDPAL
jgi:hypothetical protein